MDKYHELLRQISNAAIACDRNPREITLIAVSKTYPLDDILPVYNDGCKDFGESRIQEAIPKIECAPNDIRWHLIGTLQKNKVRKAIGKFTLIHSVDSLSLAEKISTTSLEMNIKTQILFQPREDEVPKELFDLPGIEVKGLMAIAPNTNNETVIRKCFSNLRKLRDSLGLPILSMGMSNDFKIAIEEGATHLRIGSAIFGTRET
ncbi:MAG: YggS family pyridoxal phosphate-dependent enzyme [Waddliaceae bacterium]